MWGVGDKSLLWNCWQFAEYSLLRLAEKGSSFHCVRFDVGVGAGIKYFFMGENGTTVRRVCQTVILETL